MSRGIGPATQRAIDEKRPVFVHKIIDVANVSGGAALPLKVSSNSKLGSKTTRAMFSGLCKVGAVILTLTLPERITCPSQCEFFKGDDGRSCYGDAMRHASRYTVNDALLRTLRAQLATIARKHDQFIVRLHVLGDFPSRAYVAFWAEQLELYPGMFIYGYTHRTLDDPIGRAVYELNKSERVNILLSGADRTREWNGPHSSTYRTWADAPKHTVKCPEQLTTGHGQGRGAVITCADCGLCMSKGGADISFETH